MPSINHWYYTFNKGASTYGEFIFAWLDLTDNLVPSVSVHLVPDGVEDEEEEGSDSSRRAKDRTHTPDSLEERMV